MKYGFSILETLIVLSCITITLTYSLFLYETCIKTMRTAHQHTDESMQLCRAIYLMMQDLYRVTDKQASTWLFSSREVIWPCNSGHCGYQVKDGRLIRSSGIYAKTHGMWHQRTQSLVAASIQTIRITPDIKAGLVEGVHIVLTGDCQEFSVYCACGELCLSL